MTRRALVLSLMSVLLVGAMFWARSAALPRTKLAMKEGLAYRADWSAWPDRGLPLHIFTGDAQSHLRAKPDFEMILSPQEVRDLARYIQLEKRPRGNSEQGEGKIDYSGITLWLEPSDGEGISANNGVPNVVRLEWGIAIEGDSQVAQWSHYQLTPASRRAVQRHLWKTQGDQLRRYFSPPN